MLFQHGIGRGADGVDADPARQCRGGGSGRGCGFQCCKCCEAAPEKCKLEFGGESRLVAIYLLFERPVGSGDTPRREEVVVDEQESERVGELYFANKLRVSIGSLLFPPAPQLEIYDMVRDKRRRRSSGNQLLPSFHAAIALRR